MKYTIKTPIGFVAGFSRSNQCVQIAASADWAKLFSSEKQAQKFILDYSDAGYGLNSQTAEIVAA